MAGAACLAGRGPCSGRAAVVLAAATAFAVPLAARFAAAFRAGDAALALALRGRLANEVAGSASAAGVESVGWDPRRG